MATNNIIAGSKSWIKKVPDQYAMKCVKFDENYKDLGGAVGRRLIIKYVSRNPMYSPGSGFTQEYAAVFVPNNATGVVIYNCRDSACLWAVIITKKKMETKCIHTISEDRIGTQDEKINSTLKPIYYSLVEIERQKSDEKVPKWLKQLAKKEFACNLVYFGF